MMSRIGKTWCVVRTHAHAEAKAIENLRRQGFETYLPKFRKLRSHARRRDLVVAPLFPRYCFVALDKARGRWHTIRSTIGVDRILGGDSGPASVGDEIVDELRQREDADGFIQMDEKRRLSTGEQVKLVRGIFSSCSALVEGMADKDRVFVLLEMMGRSVRVLVDETAAVRE